MLTFIIDVYFILCEIAFKKVIDPLMRHQYIIVSRKETLRVFCSQVFL